MSKFFSELACSLQLDLHWTTVFASLLGSWTSRRVIFSKLESEPACSSQVDLHWASLTFREECNVFADLFLEFICLSRDFVNQHVFLQLDLHWDCPKLPWGMQRICGPFVFQTIIMPFKRLFVLLYSLIRSLCFIQVYIFIPLIHSAPFLRAFHTFYFTPYFVLCILPREIFFLSLMTLLLGI